MPRKSDDASVTLCPICGMAMVLVRIDTRVASFSELHTFRCFACGYVRAIEHENTNYHPAAVQSASA
ncbi:MAG TPA: hypothetical protein VGF53_14900 [Pseudolabrys sp.]|jgi:transposase-like protein